MSSERTITDDTVAEETGRCSIDHLADDNLHPRVTAKKTFFDLHRHRRRDDAEASESETGQHPRIQWSAGTTNVASGYQRETYDESVTRDIMKPVLQREPSKRDRASTSPVSQSHLPSVPDKWGSMDAQPTQPEEIQHLLEPSPVIQREQTSEEVVKPKRKLREIFRKRSTAAALDSKSFEASRISEDEADTVKPEEEFKLLNERYARDGVIPAEYFTKKDIAVSGSSSRTRFSFKKGKRVSLKASVHARRSHEREIGTPRTSLDCVRPNDQQVGADKDRNTSGRESLHEKRVTIDTDAIGYPSPDESSTSPLPARRSCEPLDVKNLRKMRESEPEPGASGIGQRDGESAEGSARSEVVGAIFATRTPEVSTCDERSDDVIPRCDSEDISKGTTKEEACNTDSFKIDNPFSDFSLRNIDREKGLLRQHTPETAIRTGPSYRDPAQPGTSKGVRAMEIYRRKVSRNESVEQPKKKSREQSFLRSAVSRVKKASSFLDKAVMTQSSQRIVAMTNRPIPKIGPKGPKEQRSGIDRTFGSSFLHAIIQQLSGKSVSLARIGLKNYHDGFGREKMVFHCYNRNLQFLLVPLMENMIDPIVDHFLKNHPATSSSGLNDRSFDSVPVMAKNVMCADTISFFQTAWPKAIDDVVDVSRSRLENIPSVYSTADETGAVRGVSKLLRGCDHRGTAPLPLLREDTVQFVSVRSDELFDGITQHVVNIVLSQDLIREFLFASFGPRSVPVSNRRNFEGSHFSGLENYWPLTIGFFGTPIAVFPEDFFNIYEKRDYKKSELLERFCLSLIGNAMRQLRFTYI